jgi:hypothetical protein
MGGQDSEPKRRSWFHRIFGDTDRSFTKRTIQGLPFLSDRTKDAMSGETVSRADLEPDRPLADAEIGPDSPRQVVQDRESALEREKMRRDQRARGR